jgi:hypothetical protein
VIARKDGEHVRLWARTTSDYSSAFTRIRDAVAALPVAVQCSSEVVVLRPHRNGGAQIAAGPILVAHDVRCLGENGQAVQSGELPDLTSDIVDNPQIDIIFIF